MVNILSVWINQENHYQIGNATENAFHVISLSAE